MTFLGAWSLPNALFLTWIISSALVVKELDSLLIQSPDLGLRVSVSPTENIIAGDKVVYSVAIDHTTRSFANAVDVEVQLYAPGYLVYGSHTAVNNSLQPDNVTMSNGNMVFQFSNVSTSSYVRLAVDINVDPYYVLGSRDIVMASVVTNLLYYGAHDVCERPENKWNAKSFSRHARFSFFASKVCERVVGPLDESQFTASSFYKPDYNSLGQSPHRASFSSDGAWTPATIKKKDMHQYLQIELKQLTRITKIATKGNGNGNFVMSYVVFYSRNGLYWLSARSGMKSEKFEGNVDSVSVKENVIKIPVEAKFLRIVPKTWRQMIALKVQLFGCPLYQQPDGYQPLGLSSGHIKDDQISVQSGNQVTFPPSNARLNFNQLPGGWCTTSNTKQTLIVDLEKDYVITELAVQSRFQDPDNMIKSFYLAYKSDGGTRTYYKQGQAKKLFYGNPVEDTTIKHKLIQPISARYIYVEPKTLSGLHGCLRMELYGYRKDNIGNSDFCTLIDFENGGLQDWTRVGSAFDHQPTFSDNLYARTGSAANHEGSWWIGTRENRSSQYELPGKMQGNMPTGTLTSPAFLIPFPKLTFLFAGSANSEKSRVELLVDGSVVRTAVSETGNEPMTPVTWNVSNLVNIEGRIRLVDDDTDGFVSFDGLKASCFPNDEKIPVFEKSILVNPSQNILYVCQFSHSSIPGGSCCHLSLDNGVSWNDLSRTFSTLLGCNAITGKLYGVSTDLTNYLESSDSTGKVWKQITFDTWQGLLGDSNLIPVLEIPHIPITGLGETDGESSTILNLMNNDGGTFAASSLGVHYKAAGSGWKKIASWVSCQEYPDDCISHPCSNGGTCHSSSGTFTSCTCATGFTGTYCDTNIDDCNPQPCANGGTCVDGVNEYYCLCTLYYTGPTCAINIDDCTPSPCGLYATCIDGEGTYTCQCQSGFLGERCERETDECASVPCKNGGLCVDGIDSYQCHCRRGYSGIDCETAHTSAFEVIGSTSVTYGKQNYLVVHARLPSDGRSLHQSWCHDYQALCQSLGNRRPTGCGRSYNHIVESHQCQISYDSVMDHNDTLNCPPNDLVSTIAKNAGYSGSNSANSFAFSQCAPSNCSDVLPQSGCHGALACINQGVPSREVYTLCTYSDSNFIVKDKRRTTFKGVDYLALYVQPTSATPKETNWCRDYQRLCESYGKRPTGCGRSSVYTSCTKDYFSIMPANDDLGCESPLIEVVGQNAGLPSTSQHFGFRDCSQCSTSSGTCVALNCLGAYDGVTNYHVLCTVPRTSFTVLEERETYLDNTSLLVIKARIPNDRRSTQGDWCGDYYALCDSYGLKPTGCSVTPDNRYTSCRDNYGSVKILQDDDGACQPELQVSELARNVGFFSATSSNSFAFHKCTECSSILGTSDCSGKGLGCVEPSKHDDVYTVCVDHSASFDVLETKPTTLGGIGFLAVKAEPPKKPNSNWTSEYEMLCSNYGYQPIKCSAITPETFPPISQTVNQIACTNGSFKTILQKAGLLNVTDNIVFNTSTFSSSNGFVYAVCGGPDSNFDVISTKVTQHDEIPYLVIEAWLPSHGLSRHENWCEDYRRLCYAYGHLPLGCGGKTHLSDSDYSSCRVRYEFQMSQSDTLGCPLSPFVSTLAKQAGFAEPNITNSFGFSFCNATGCAKNISERNHFSSVNVDSPVYTVCTKLDANITVESTRDITYRKGTYKVIRANVGSRGLSRTWCEEYRRLCASYSLHPVVIPKHSDLTCEEKHDGIALGDQELSEPEEVRDIVRNAGYSNAISKTILTFQNNCHNRCYTDLTAYKNASDGALYIDVDAVTVQNDIIYALCMNSDSNFQVIDKTSVVYENRTYLVLKAMLPANGLSKHDDWCADYQKLCRGYQMRPVAFLASSQTSTSCIRDRMAVIIPRNTTVEEHVSVVANFAGYSAASKASYFALGECDAVCPTVLRTKCSPCLDCLTTVHPEAYTVCTDSDSSLIVEKANYIYHKGARSVIIQAQLPANTSPRHGEWCIDYYRICRSFDMKPVWCALSSSSSCCDVDYQPFVLPAEETERQNVVVFNCTSQESGFKVIKMNTTEYDGQRLTIVKTQVIPKGNDWCEDYKGICSSLGKRPFSCLLEGDAATYGTRNQYNAYLYSGACPSTEVLRNLTVQAGFSDISNGSAVNNSSQATGSSNTTNDIVVNNSSQTASSKQNVLGFMNCPQCGKNINEVSCFAENVTDIVYTFCSEYSDSNFDVRETKEVEYAGLSYTVVQAWVPLHGKSKGASWCEDYEKVCKGIGKRPMGCGKDAAVLKQSRDCRVNHDAAMIEGLSCPGSQELADIAGEAGFPATVEQSLGLWNCTECSNNFTDVWDNTNLASEVYAVCLGSDSNFNVLEKRTIKHNGARLTVIMATLPQHGMSLHEDWCRDLSKLCGSYELRPLACPKSTDSVDEHAQCRDHYQALMFSSGTTDCSESSGVHVIANAAGFKHANSDNSFMFRSCLPQQCTKFFSRGDEVANPFGKVNPSDHVVYTVCASSDSNYEVLATKSVTTADMDYLVIRGKIPADGVSKFENWCRDYQRLCEGYNMKPLICNTASTKARACVYDYDPTKVDTACPVTSGVAAVAKQAGFDDVSSENSVAFGYCDGASCVARMPNQDCWQSTTYELVITNVTTEANITRVDYLEGNDTVYCLIIPDATPPLIVNDSKLIDLLKNFTCNSTMNLDASNVTISYFNITATQTFEDNVARVTTSCRFNSASPFSRMSGEMNTVCVRPSKETNFQIQGTRKVVSSGREYLIIKAKLLSSTSKSSNWCTDYKNLCQSLRASPLACPRTYGFNTDYLKCLTSYEAIMMTGVHYDCPSNGFISRLAQSAGYHHSSETNTFSLLKCHNDTCVSTLPLTGCSDSLHCLSQQLRHKHVYTACVVANSDSNFHITERLSKTIYNQKITALRMLIPTTKSLHDNWCMDYERVCTSLGQRPFYHGSENDASRFCRGEYNALTIGSSIPWVVRQVGFSEATGENTFSFRQCDSCSSVLTSHCHGSLNCLKTGVREVYTICGNVDIGFIPLATQPAQQGSQMFRVVQAQITTKLSPKSDWGLDYKLLCNSYNEMPTGCGKRAADANSNIKTCEQEYSSYILPGDELQCDSNDVISKLARDAGFVNASPGNSFGFASCNTKTSTISSGSCVGSMPCLGWQATDPVVAYTVCVKNTTNNFKVLATKTVNYKDNDFLVIHARLPEDGRSLQATWCSDYQKLCEDFGMRPTGCGDQMPNNVLCSTNYGSYMPASNNLGCGNSEVASEIAKQAGFATALPASTFVFHSCHECSKQLSGATCDSALGCISPMLWKREVYTLCVDPPTKFNVVRTASVQRNATKYLVIEAKLPSDGRAKSENWCRDYQKLCEQHGAFPVSCEKDHGKWECTQEHKSIIAVGLPCDNASTHAASIAVDAGFAQATQSNSFVLKDCSPQSCSKDLTSACDEGLSCLSSSTPNNVYAICADEKTPTFKIIDSKKLSIFGTDLTVVSATLHPQLSGTWCQDYSKLCHTVGQSPAVLPSDVLDEDILKCRDKFDGVLLRKEMEQSIIGDGVHTLARKAGFSDASYGNTFAFSTCSEESCNGSSYALNCSQSLQCLNGETKAGTVYGLCVENTPLTNFDVLDTGVVTENGTQYLALKVRIPVHRLSKYGSWCKDYEDLCHSHKMRPLTSTSSSTCTLDYKAITHGYAVVADIAKQAGFQDASSNNIYCLESCSTEECGREFQLPHCLTGSCSESTNKNRLLYVLCSSLSEQFATSFEVQEVRNVWSRASFLVAHVKLPSQGKSKQEDWCEEYRVFCASYGRRPYSSAGLLMKGAVDYANCFWKYNATSYRVPVQSSTIAQDAGFNPASGCVTGLSTCTQCKNRLDSTKCPFENCQAAVGTCYDYYIICT